MRLVEDSYGRAKRLDFICSSIEKTRPRQILDIGCGAGTQLTAPLAAAFPEIAVIGVDEDARSLAWARTHAVAGNLAFAAPAELAPDRRFDLVIASEVLEHVADPADFLRRLIARLAPAGRLIVTVPNGYGVFEWMALAEVLLNLSGLQAKLRRLKGGQAASVEAEPVTLANSPHVNFFSFRELDRLFAAAGLAVERYHPRTVVCGYLVDSILRHPLLVAWNARLADHLPSWCASDWMFELRVLRPPAPIGWRRGRWARFRKRLNERRWDIA
jgi:SAM-dependent methyltransferase